MPKASVVESLESPTKIWGKVITELRTMNLPFLFVACGEICEIKISQDKLILSVASETKELINKENNKILLENILKKLGYCYIVELNEIKHHSKENRKFEILKELFEECLIIKGDKNEF